MAQDPQNDLAYIRQVMEQTRRFTMVSGNYFIVWGLIISVGLVCTNVIAMTSIRLPLIAIWIALITVGWVLSFWLGYRKVRYEPVTTYAVRLISSLWVACGIAMTTAFLMGPWVGAVPYFSIGGLSALFIGIGIFMTGILNGMHWFRNLAIGWWIGAVVMFVWHGLATLWISAGLLIVLMVIPGFILNKQAQSLRKSVQ